MWPARFEVNILSGISLCSGQDKTLVSVMMRKYVAFLVRFLNVASLRPRPHSFSSFIYVYNFFSFSFVKEIVSSDFVSDFFIKQLLLVPLDTLRNFCTVTEELFNFKGDSLVYTQPGSIYHWGV
jgi:hypothetical protein